jgi:hypothetical protein
VWSGDHRRWKNVGVQCSGGSDLCAVETSTTDRRLVALVFALQSCWPGAAMRLVLGSVIPRLVDY